MSEGKELTITEGREITAADANSAGVLAMVLNAARDPDIDAAKVKTMADLAIMLQDRERQTEFNRDLNAAKKEMPSIGRTGEIKVGSEIRSRFSPWEKLGPIVEGVLARHNMTLGHDIGTTDRGMVTVEPFLIHDNGMERRGKEMAFPADTTGSKSAAQAVVSSSSYGQRVTTIKFLNIQTHDPRDADKDGNAPGGGSIDLRPDLQELVNSGRSAAMDGLAAYDAWFKALPAAKKGWLIEAEYHGQNKAAAEQVGA